MSSYEKFLGESYANAWKAEKFIRQTEDMGMSHNFAFATAFS